MEFQNLEAAVQGWIDYGRDALEEEAGASIPPVGDLWDTAFASWDDYLSDISDAWSTELRQRLLSAFGNQRNGDVASRYTALLTYLGLFNYLVSFKGEIPLSLTLRSEDGLKFRSDPQSVQVRDDLQFLVNAVPVQEVHDWRTIRWEITNSYLIDNWERAFQLYERAAELNLVSPRDLSLMRGHLRFLLSIPADGELSPLQRSLVDNCYIRRRARALHPFNWEPRVYDADAVPSSLLLLASGLNIGPDVGEPGQEQQNDLQMAIREIEQAGQGTALPPPYHAILAACRLRLGQVRHAIADHEALLDTTSKSPWDQLKANVYRSLADCYLEMDSSEKAIQTLQSCAAEFPHEADVYMKIAELQARGMNFEGTEATLREAEQFVLGITDDWRVSTFLALRGISDAKGDKAEGELARRFLETRPEVAALIGTLCSAYWPSFERLCREAKAEWILGLFKAYYVSAQEPNLRASLEQSALRSFALAAEIELKSRVFDAFKKAVAANPDLQRAADDLSNNSEKFRKYLTAQGYLSLKEMYHVIEDSRGAQKGIFADFRAWLQQNSHQGIFDKKKHFRKAAHLRNRASHERVPDLDLESAHKACRAVIEGIHNR